MISAFLGVRFFVLLSSKNLVICITEELLFYFCVRAAEEQATITINLSHYGIRQTLPDGFFND